MIDRITAARTVQGHRTVQGQVNSAQGTLRGTQSAFGSMLRQQAEENHRAGNVRTGTLSTATESGANATGNAGNAAGSLANAQTVNFSRHALARVAERGIALTPTLMEKLSDSVERAQEKGAKNILAFDATQAFIINIPYGRVITTMSQEEMRENIFTNIDGAVLL